MTLRVRAMLLAILLVCTSTASAFAVPSSDEEMRGVWVSSVYNLDYPLSPTTSSDTLKKQADSILEQTKNMGLNTVFLQVRPSADALYPSTIFPWSKYLTGTVGVAPTNNFDPLRYWIDGAHARGLQLHAWINPYRVTKGKEAEYNALPATSPAKKHPEWVVKYTDNNYYFNPGLPEVRQLVQDGIAEIINSYPDIDGIHMDDYFYPGTDFNDSATYAKYAAGFSNLADWRRENVNILVRNLNTMIHAKNAAISFGISPSGVWANKSDDPRGSDTNGGNPSYTRAYADTLTWISEGIVDYVCPQIYWYIGQKAADYSVLVQWWSNAVKGSDVKLYIGEAAYKCDDASAGTVWKGSTELIKHLTYAQNMPEVDGHIFFRYGSFTQVSGLSSAVQSYYASITPTPAPLTPEQQQEKATVVTGYVQTLMLFFQALLR